MTDELSPKKGRVRKRGYTQVYHEIWTHYLPIIGRDALVYYLYLLKYRHTKDDPMQGKAWPGRRTIIDELCISAKQLPKIDAILEAADLVKIERIASGSGRPRIQYTVNDPLTAEQFKENDVFVAVRKVVVAEGKLQVSAGRKIYNDLKTTKEEERIKDSADTVIVDEKEETHDSSQGKPFESYNSRDIINYFCVKYLERYKEPYVPSYGREGKQIKDKLLASMPPERVIKLIDVVIDRYSSEWASPKYERPTIGALCGWLANKAVVYIVDDAAERSEEAQQAPIYDYETMKREGRL